MLSILIPLYNNNAEKLVRGLREKAASEGIAYEVVLGDDGSTADMHWLDALEAFQDIRLYKARHNTGRAAIRNAMAHAARGEWLLMIDSDAKVEADFSFSAYLEAAAQSPVVCGGLRHPEVNPNPQATLRYKYERHADRQRSAAQRSRTPYQHLSTFNLLVKKEVFEQIGGFDPDCKEYGYEDVLFGAELARRNIPISHIENPLVHMGLEPNAVFLDKTEASLRTLQHLKGKLDGQSTIENTAHIINTVGMRPLVTSLFRRAKPRLRRNLLGSNPSLYLFKCYKLGYFLSLPDTPSA